MKVPTRHTPQATGSNRHSSPRPDGGPQSTAPVQNAQRDIGRVRCRSKSAKKPAWAVKSPHGAPRRHRPNAADEFTRLTKGVARSLGRSAFISLIMVVGFWIMNSSENGRKVFTFGHIPGQGLLAVFGLLLTAALTLLAGSLGLGFRQKTANPGRVEFLNRLAWMIMLGSWCTAYVGAFQALGAERWNFLTLPPPVDFPRLVGSLALGAFVGGLAAFVSEEGALPTLQQQQFRQKDAAEIRSMLDRLPHLPLSRRQKISQYALLFAVPASLDVVATMLWIPSIIAPRDTWATARFSIIWITVSFFLSAILIPLMTDLCRTRYLRRYLVAWLNGVLALCFAALLVLVASIGAFEGLVVVTPDLSLSDGLPKLFRVTAISAVSVTGPCFMAWVYSQPLNGGTSRGIILELMIRQQEKLLKKLEGKPLTAAQQWERTRTRIVGRVCSITGAAAARKYLKERPAVVQRIRLALTGAVLIVLLLLLSQAAVLFI